MLERIDGQDYEVGTPAHAATLAARNARFDAAYLQAHDSLVQRNIRLLRSLEWQDDRMRTDANLSLFLARDLVHVRATVERTIYDALRTAEFVPASTDTPRGAQSYATRLLDERGKAKISHTLAGDSPRADVSASEDIKPLVNIRGSYGYDVQDLEYAAFSGIALPRERAIACGNMIARGLDDVGRSGDAATGLTGFFNSATVTVHGLTNGEWNTETDPDKILADLYEIEQTIITAARDNQPMGYTLILPTAYEGKLATMKAGTNTQMSVKEYFLKNARVVTSVERWIKLDDAVTPDVAASDAPMGICYAKNPSSLYWPIPITYEEQPPELDGWEWLVEARARCGGVEFRQPALALYIENLD